VLYSTLSNPITGHPLSPNLYQLRGPFYFEQIQVVQIAGKKEIVFSFLK
jgi:serine kinase of HPr protein (carbohydrate metabolism regulator)